MARLPALIEPGPGASLQVWCNGVRLAGALKTVEAAPALAKWITVSTEPTLTLSSEAQLRTSPAGKALVQIGDPAIPALQNLLEDGNKDQR